MRAVVYDAEFFAERREFIVLFVFEKGLRDDERIVIRPNDKFDFFFYGKPFQQYIVERVRVVPDEYATA